MKVFLVLIAAMFTLPILLIAGFQLIRIIAIELTDLVKEAWRSPEIQSPS
jgi:hypothetical protein